MKNIASLALLSLLLSNHAAAQNTTPATEALTLAPSPATVSTSNTETTQAEVRKVDVAAGKLTLRHGEIKNLDMPPMTMVFQVKDRAFLTQIKAGDQVKFTADKIKGAYTVLSIEVIQ
jgi:Cu/Ag efflux protein CusF